MDEQNVSRLYPGARLHRISPGTSEIIHMIVDGTI